MFGQNKLKQNIEITEASVECPVKGCRENVIRQRIVFKRENRFMCPMHEIYISPSTFEYKDYHSNLLWESITDIALLESIMKVKRESRISRDNSEDSLTWNTFRFLEKEELISEYVYNTLATSISGPQLVYWSYSPMVNGIYELLEQARNEFELVPSKGSEPDLIIIGEDNLIFIEAKLTAKNETCPSNQNVEEKYVSGGADWWKEVFASDFSEVANKAKKYELARFGYLELGWRRNLV